MHVGKCETGTPAAESTGGSSAGLGFRYSHVFSERFRLLGFGSQGHPLFSYFFSFRLLGFGSGWHPLFGSLKFSAINFLLRYDQKIAKIKFSAIRFGPQGHPLFRLFFWFSAIRFWVPRPPCFRLPNFSLKKYASSLGRGRTPVLRFVTLAPLGVG